MWRFLKAVIPLVLAVVLWNESLYVVAQESVTIGWDPVAGATTYEVVAVWEGASGDREQFFLPPTTATEFLVERIRGGFFYFQVRACASSQCSTWSQSKDAACAVVDGVARGWRVFFEITPPGGGGIE